MERAALGVDEPFDGEGHKVFEPPGLPGVDSCWDVAVSSSVLGSRQVDRPRGGVSGPPREPAHFKQVVVGHDSLGVHTGLLSIAGNLN